MKNLILVIALITLAACAKKDDPVTSNPSGPEPLKPMTTKASCENGASVNSLVGTWATVTASPNFKITTEFNFDRVMATVANHCEFNGNIVTAQVQVPYQDYGIRLTFPSPAQKTEKVGDASCSIGIDAKSIDYSFYGSCLVFHDAKAGDLYLNRVP